MLIEGSSWVVRGMVALLCIVLGVLILSEREVLGVRCR